MNTRKLMLCGLLWPVLSSGLLEAREQEASPDAKRPLLINADQLHSKLNDDNLRILDARSESDYAKGHIPGAIRVDVSQWKNMAAAEGGFHDAKGWSRQLGQIGLKNGMSVAVYGSKLSDTARIWWLLKYAGVKDVSLLDGGWEWWKKQHGPADTKSSAVLPTKFEPHFQADRLAEFASLKDSFSAKTTKLVDTRSTEEFKEGRIPGSTHLEWKELLAADGRFKSKTQLKQLFRERGILPAETAVCY